jgi:predicted ferric reductase
MNWETSLVSLIAAGFGFLAVSWCFELTKRLRRLESLYENLEKTFSEILNSSRRSQ